ncbi:MAG: tRNA glutamyl-Q(34) synthetase GluQRS [Phycisphaeraceae bacterium]|nr:MAG: tRNA glutamyl-Q(34) synthetase GluQRS [Phycisphaeraceae bacterium]
MPLRGVRRVCSGIFVRIVSQSSGGQFGAGSRAGTIPPDQDTLIVDHGPHGAVETTRLAPSPTGALHLGNARTFLVNWALARQRGWRIVLRIEDLDGPRNKPGAADEAIQLLEWLGMDWDEGPHRQAHDLDPYRDAMSRLAAAGRVYACELTRSQIEAAASAPQEQPSGDAGRESHFPPELRPTGAGEVVRFQDTESNWRLMMPDREVRFVDEFAGEQRLNPQRTIGDMVVWTRRNEPAYQLAVVVDDHRHGVTRVVRGDDLLDSAARQATLYNALGISPTPRWMHLPLVVGPDGRRLAKRHGDTRVMSYRDAGAGPERVIGLIASWCGLERRDMSAAEFAGALRPDTIPRSPIICTPEDDAWLLRR